MKTQTIHGKITIGAFQFNIVSSCIIGRDDKPRVDLPIDNYYISRKHLEIVSQDGNLFMICNGGNGILVDNIFHGSSSAKILLPHICQLRFPSTEIVLTVESEKSILKYPIKKRFNTASSEHESGIDISENYVPNKRHPKSKQLTPDYSDHLDTSPDGKPPYSYAQMIIQAIMSQPSQKMTLSEIYHFISRQYPFYKLNQKGWQNSIRHNLSLNRYFVRVARCESMNIKSAYWEIEKDQKENLARQAYWKRKSKTGTFAGIIKHKPKNLELHEISDDLSEDTKKSDCDKTHQTSQDKPAKNGPSSKSSFNNKNSPNTIVIDDEINDDPSI